MPHTISKEQLVAFYDAHWNEMKEYILGHYLTGWNAHAAAHKGERFAPVRNGDNGAPIEIKSKAQFLNLVKAKYLTEIMPEIPLITHEDETNELVVDMDSPFPMEQNKLYAIDLWLFAEKNIPKDLHPHITEEFTGGKSFHLRIKINPFLKWEAAKELLEQDIIAPFYQKYGIKVTFLPTQRSPSRSEKKTRVHLDMSPMKTRGTMRCAYSFYDDTNRFEKVFHTLDELKRFKIEDATFTGAIPIEDQMKIMLDRMTNITAIERSWALKYFLTTHEDPINKSGLTLTAAFHRWMILQLEKLVKPNKSISPKVVLPVKSAEPAIPSPSHWDEIWGNPKPSPK